MMKQQIFSYTNGMNQDISKSKLANTFYYEGRNIRIITNEAFGSVTNQKGNELKLTIPSVDSNPTNKAELANLSYPLDNFNILGHTVVNKDLYLLTKSLDPAVDTSRFFYAQKQSSAPDPYIDSNLRVIVDGTIVFESFVDSGGAVEGPSLSVGKKVRFQGFYLASEPNEPAPAPTLYLDIYKNGVLVSRQNQFCADQNITLFYDVITEVNDVWFAHAYTLPQPGQIDNPFSEIDVDSLRLDGEPFAIWKVTEDYQIELKYFDLIDVANKKLDVESFYENPNNIKIYWADGVAELRFINIADPDVMNLNKNFLSTVPKVNLTQPEITGFSVGGSSHTSGSIQYAYNLYNQFGAQTRISPLSEIFYLNNDESGNQAEVNVAKSPNILINNIDTRYDMIRIYSIKYDIKNTTPKISLIYDRPVQSVINFTDDNNSVINEIAFTEFIFLGGEVYIPEHIFTKDNHLFLANYRTKQYTIDFDARAYRYDKNGNTVITQSDGSESIGFNISDIQTTNIDFDHDCVNPTNKAIETEADYNKYIWKSFNGQTIPSETVNFYNYTICSLDQGDIFSLTCFTYIDLNNKINAGCVQNKQCVQIIAKEGSVQIDSTKASLSQLALETTVTTDPVVIGSGILGGLGPNVGFEIKYRQQQSNIGQPSMTMSPSLATTQKNSDLTGLKSGEVYRLFIEFLLEDGKFSFPKWIADVKIPDVGSENAQLPINESGLVAYPYIEVELINKPQDNRIIGWRTAIVERTESNKTVLTQGLYNPAIQDNLRSNVDCFPSYFQRTIRKTTDLPVVGSELNKPQRINFDNSGEAVLSSNNDSATSQNEREITASYGDYSISSIYGNIYTPEAVLTKSNLNLTGTRLRKLGYLKNSYSYSSRKIFDNTGLESDDLEEITGEGSNISRNTTEEGALLLTNMIVPPVISNSAGKFISDNRLVTDDKFWSKKTFAYVRYFTGYSKTRDVTNVNKTVADASGKLYKMSAIENIYSFRRPSTNTSINFATGANIPVFRSDQDIPSITFKSYSGSNIAVTDIGLLNDHSDDLVSMGNDDYGVMLEIYRILENQYGGNSYEARQSNRTIPYSGIVSIEDNKTISHYGDTFIQKFNSLRTFKSENTEIYMTEIVSVPVETSINLDLRFDLLKYRGDNEDADELTSYGYNPVYDQKNNTIKGVPKPTNFTEINNFPTNILPSKVKLPNENIDSFTDFLINDVKTLDGKYGEITGVGEYNDTIYAFQRNSIAYLAINPRVQLSGSDGIQVELGSGRLIERYQYLTTNSGTINKWSIVKTKNGLMYFDLLNKSINFIADQELSTVKGIYNKLKDYCDQHTDLLSVDNIILNQGVHAYYDSLNEDIYFTFLTDNDKFTVAYNGLVQGFTSYYDFFPKYYLQFGNKMLSTKAGIDLWEHDKGNYQIFYGEFFPSSITMMMNPEPTRNKIFNNILFEAETYLNGSDVHDLTFNKLKVWNEYQDSGTVPLQSSLRPALRRKFRNWAIQVPRNQNSRDRINNPWSYVQFIFDNNTANYKLVLHDMILNYL